MMTFSLAFMDFSGVVGFSPLCHDDFQPGCQGFFSRVLWVHRFALPFLRQQSIYIILTKITLGICRLQLPTEALLTDWKQVGWGGGGGTPFK